MARTSRPNREAARHRHASGAALCDVVRIRIKVMVHAKTPGRRPGVVDFLDNKRGNVAIIFGLSVIPMFALGLMAIDFTRLAIARSRLQQAVDAAVLQTAAKLTPSSTDADALRQATIFVQNNFPNVNTVVSAQAGKPVISADRLSVCISATATIKSTAPQFKDVYQDANVGWHSVSMFKDTMTPAAKSCANLAGGTDPNTTYEIALVLDNTGSMNETDNSGVTKIQALINSATSFTNTMFSKVTTGKLKISVVPFEAAVKAVDPTISSNRTLSWIDTGGNSSQHWTVFGDPGAGPFADLAARNLAAKNNANANGFTSRFDIYAKLKAVKSSWDWNGCFEPQPYPMNVNDTPPSSSSPDTLFVPYLSPDEPNNNAYLDSYLNDDPTNCPNTNNTWRELIKACKYKNTSVSSNSRSPDGVCVSSSSQLLMRLSGTQSTILNKISGLQAGGTTNLHEGFMWGWRTISPNSPFADALPYDKSATATNRKVMIFMTDGFNNWQSNPGTVGGSQYEAPGYYSLDGLNTWCSGCGKNLRLPDGSQGNNINYQTQLAAAAPNNFTDYHDLARQALDELTLEACTNAKAQGIEIFTIGFTIPSDPIDAQGLALLQNCATNKDHYFTAQNANDLNAVFASIGTGLGKLRLSL